MANREILFRGWDGTKMYYHDDTMRHGNITLCFNDISGWNFYYEPTNIHTRYACGASHSERDILMQFIEKRDKLKKEIYDGDIIKAPFGNHGSGANMKTKDILCVVVWRGDSWGFKNLEPHGQYRFYPDWEDCEIIGNIYQNPELLKHE